MYRLWVTPLTANLVFKEDKADCAFGAGAGDLFPASATSLQAKIVNNEQTANFYVKCYDTASTSLASNFVSGVNKYPPRRHGRRSDDGFHRGVTQSGQRPDTGG